MYNVTVVDLYLIASSVTCALVFWDPLEQRETLFSGRNWCNRDAILCNVHENVAEMSSLNILVNCLFNHANQLSHTINTRYVIEAPRFECGSKSQWHDENDVLSTIPGSMQMYNINKQVEGALFGIDSSKLMLITILFKKMSRRRNPVLFWGRRELRVHLLKISHLTVPRTMGESGWTTSHSKEYS